MEPIEKLLFTGKYTRKDLISIYRFLCKHTHPDITRDGGEQFLRVRQVYESALARFEERSVNTPGAAIDPLGFGRYIDLPDVNTPRAYLFSALRLYFLLGLHSYRVRSLTAQQERNNQVLQAVRYWAEVYNKEFAEDFQRFNENIFLPVSDIRKMKQYTQAKRLFVSGAELFLHFQETGREISRKLAGEKLSFALSILKRLNIHDATEGFILFLLEELPHPREEF